MLGGITGLRLPETLHHRLPQTIEEGEEFGKDWTVNDCLHCRPAEASISQPSSYENLDVLHSNTASDVELEMNACTSPRRSMRQRPKSIINERTPLDASRPSRPSMKRLVRQMSVMDTQRTEDGTMQLTHWI